jgi:hypothetical protein
MFKHFPDPFGDDILVEKGCYLPTGGWVSYATLFVSGFKAGVSVSVTVARALETVS